MCIQSVTIAVAFVVVSMEIKGGKCVRAESQENCSSYMVGKSQKAYPLARKSLNIDIDDAFRGEDDQIASPLEGHFDVLIGLQDTGGRAVHLFDFGHVQGPIVRATNQRGTRIDVTLVLTDSRNLVARRSSSEDFVGDGHVQLVHVRLALAKVAAERSAALDASVEDEITISVPFSRCFYRKGLDVIPFHGKELNSLAGQTFHVDQKESCWRDDHQVPPTLIGDFNVLPRQKDGAFPSTSKAGFQGFGIDLNAIVSEPADDASNVGGLLDVTLGSRIVLQSCAGSGQLCSHCFREDFVTNILLHLEQIDRFLDKINGDASGPAIVPNPQFCVRVEAAARGLHGKRLDGLVGNALEFFAFRRETYSFLEQNAMRCQKVLVALICGTLKGELDALVLTQEFWKVAANLGFGRLGVDAFAAVAENVQKAHAVLLMIVLLKIVLFETLGEFMMRVPSDVGQQQKWDARVT